MLIALIRVLSPKLNLTLSPYTNYFITLPKCEVILCAQIPRSTGQCLKIHFPNEFQAEIHIM